MSICCRRCRQSEQAEREVEAQDWEGRTAYELGLHYGLAERVLAVVRHPTPLEVDLEAVAGLEAPRHRLLVLASSAAGEHTTSPFGLAHPENPARHKVPRHATST